MAADLLEIELYLRVWAKAKPRTRAWFFFWAPREWFWNRQTWEEMAQGEYGILARDAASRDQIENQVILKTDFQVYGYDGTAKPLASDKTQPEVVETVRQGVLKFLAGLASKGWSVAIVGNTFGTKVPFERLCLSLRLPAEEPLTARVASWTVERRS